MTRCIFGFLCVCALGVVPLAGCTDDGGDGGSGGTAGTGGTGGDGGTGGGGGTGGMGREFPCTEQGIRDATAEGGGPHTFDCGGPRTVVTEAEIAIDNDVILNGEGNLTLDANEGHPVVWVHEGKTAELHAFTLTGGNAIGGQGGGILNQGDLVIEDCSIRDNAASDDGGGIFNSGTLTITDSTISGNSVLDYGGGISNTGTLTLTDCTVSENSAERQGGGIRNLGTLTVIRSDISANSADVGGAIQNGTIGVATITNTTVSGNVTLSEQLSSAAIDNFRGFGEAGLLTMVNCTVSGNTGGGIDPGGPVRLSSTIVSDDCRDGDIGVTSLGYNIESPGNTCGFDQTGDQSGVTVGRLNLGELADNDGPTMTHALRAPSDAIDRIPEAMCLDAGGQPLTTDQRGVTRPQGYGCDVGAIEWQPSDPTGTD